MRELIFLLSITRNYVVSVRRGFLFLLVLGTGCVILIWQSLGRPYKLFTCWLPGERSLLFVTLIYYTLHNNSQPHRCKRERERERERERARSAGADRKFQLQRFLGITYRVHFNMYYNHISRTGKTLATSGRTFSG